MARPDTILSWYRRLVDTEVRWLEAPGISAPSSHSGGNQGTDGPFFASIGAGAMTGSSARWRVWAIRSRTGR